MKNFVQQGTNITLFVGKDVASGQGVQAGSLFGVAIADAESGDLVTITTEGVFTLPKEATTDTFAVGDAVEWDDVNSRIAALDSGVAVGVIVKAASATDAKASVRLR